MKYNINVIKSVVECPNCKLLNLPGVMRCECGYELSDTAVVYEARSPFKETNRTKQQMKNWTMEFVGCLWASGGFQAIADAHNTETGNGSPDKKPKAVKQ